MNATPPIVDRQAWEEQVQALRVEKAHTRAGDALAAARRRLPMVEVDASTPVVGAHGAAPLIDVFEGRSQLYAAFMIPATSAPPASLWHTAATELRQPLLFSRRVGGFGKTCTTAGELALP